MNDCIPTTRIDVFVQENGIIRLNDTGLFLGRLDGVKYEDLKQFSVTTIAPSTFLTFGQALDALKEKKRVARAGWNGKGMYLGLCEGGGFRDGYRTADFVYIKTAQDTNSPWQPSNGDMLAEDWNIVE